MLEAVIPFYVFTFVVITMGAVIGHQMLQLHRSNDALDQAAYTMQKARSVIGGLDAYIEHITGIKSEDNVGAIRKFMAERKQN